MSQSLLSRVKGATLISSLLLAGAIFLNTKKDISSITPDLFLDQNTLTATKTTPVKDSTEQTKQLFVDSMPPSKYSEWNDPDACEPTDSPHP